MYNERPKENEKKVKSIVLICAAAALAVLILLVPLIVSFSFNRTYDNLSSEVKNLSISVELLRSSIKELERQVEKLQLEQVSMESESPIITGDMIIFDTADSENPEVDEIGEIEEEMDVVYDTFDGFPPIPAETPISELQTNWIPGMDYRTITNHWSEQWAMQLQSTTNEYGARVYKGYICSAMASYYTHTVGDTFHVILNNGSEFDVICGDFKDDGTDLLYRGQRCRNYDKEEAISVLEFIMDTPNLQYDVLQAGIFNKIPFFGGIYGDGGNIISIEKTGHLDIDMSVLYA